MSEIIAVETTRRGKPRQRSAIACELCHTRRVRCTIGTTGTPCDLCRKVQHDCKAKASNRQGHRRPTPNDTATLGYIPRHESDGQDRPRLPSLAGSPGNSTWEQEESLYTQVLEGQSAKSPQGSNLQHVVYLGETFNLTHLIRTARPEGLNPTRHHYTQGLLSPTAQDILTTSILQQQDAFSLPDAPTTIELIRAYFTAFHPHYPILDRNTFAESISDFSRPQSYLLLQSVLFTAAGHCDITVIHRAGYASRYQARQTIFRRARALYDADHELGKVNLVQSLFLMSFWWDKSTDQKDTWHWLGCAVSSAVTIGMHRSTRDSPLSPEERRLWKRIWWSIFVEDKHAALALGRPPHIRARDCDVGILTEDDMEEQLRCDESVYGGKDDAHMLYVVKLAEMSLVVDRIIESVSDITGSTEATAGCLEELQAWKSSLPLDWGSRGKGSMWILVLDIAYNWFLVVIRRSHAHSTSESRSGDPEVGSAASSIVRSIEVLLSSDQIHLCPIHLIPAMFAAMAIIISDTSSTNSLKAEMAQIKLRTCLLALREMRATWPVAGWIYTLFSRMLGKRINHGLATSNGNFPAADTAMQNGMNTQPVQEVSNTLESSFDWLPSGDPTSASFQPAIDPAIDPSLANVDWDTLFSTNLHFPTAWDTLAPMLDPLQDLSEAPYNI